MPVFTHGICKVEEDVEFYLETYDSNDGIDERVEFEVESVTLPSEVELRSKSDLVLLCPGYSQVRVSYLVW